jgi:hypothetical protein
MARRGARVLAIAKLKPMSVMALGLWTGGPFRNIWRVTKSSRVEALRERA